MSNWLEQAVTEERTWCEVRRVVSELDAHLLASSDAINTVLEASPTLLKNDRTTTLATYKVANETLVIKRYNARNQWHKVKRSLRRTRAERCWQLSYLFFKAGLNVARPVMLLEERFGPFRQNAFFVNEMLKGEELLSALPKMNAREQQQVKVAINEAFVIMQNAMLTHGDMKASNLIWNNGLLYFIDLDAAQFHRSKLTWVKANNKDRKRFLKNWCDDPVLNALFDDI